MTTLTTRTTPAPLDEATARTEGALRTVRRGLRLSPEFRAGLAGTILLALVATVGRRVVPIAIQQTIDRGLRPAAARGADIGFVRDTVLVCAVVVIITALNAY